MKKIKLTQGKYALVDNEDYPLLSRHKWLVHKTRGGSLYVESSSFAKGKQTFIHRAIMGRGRKDVDHINRNPLDNRKNNLRFVTKSENLINRRRFKGTKSKYKGVYFNETNKRFQASVYRNKKSVHIGLFIDEKQAKIARDKYIIKHSLQ